MHFLFLLISALLLSLRASAKSSCRDFIPVHEVVSAPDGVLSIDDEEGARQIKANVFNTPDCQVNPVNPTGNQFGGNYTVIGQAGQSPDSCEIKNIDGVLTVNSFQAIVIETNGWPLDNVSLNFDDFDSSNFGQWREAGLVFGLRDNTVILPSIELNSDTVLAVNNYNLPVDSLSLMGFGLGALTSPGVAYSSSTLINCPITDSPEARRCRAKFSFSEPVDTIAIIYTLVSRGSVTTRSAAVFSELLLSCGCRCRETNPGTRMALTPVSGATGQCTRREISGTRIQCDVLGGQWCIKEDTIEYTLTGNTLPNGNLECVQGNGTKLIAESAFSPDPNFGGSS